MDKNTLDLKVCRLCLETNCRIYDINKNKLTNMLDDFTSSKVMRPKIARCGCAVHLSATDTNSKVVYLEASDMPGIPPYVCSFCCALLRKATTFRNRCIEVQNYLHECSLIEPLSIDIINKMDRSKIQNQLNTSEILTLSCNSGDTIDNKQNIIKIENDSESNDNDFGDEFDLSIENQSVFVKLEDNIKPESSNQDAGSKSFTRTEDIKKEVNTKMKKKKDKITKDVLKKVLQQQILDATDELRKKFCSFILEKYVLKTKNTMDQFDLDDEVTEKKNVPSAEDLEKMDPNERIFYEYVNEKYKKGTLDKKKVVNVLRHSRIPEFKVNKVLPQKKLTKMERYHERNKEDLRRFCDEFNFEMTVLSKEEQIAEQMARKDDPKFVNSRFKCMVCFRGFKTKATYRTHLFAHDPSTGAEVCEICQSRFPTRLKLNTHQSNRHTRKFVCKTCGKELSCRSQATIHFAGHGAKKYVCEHCGRVFNKYRSRVDHIRIHHGTSRCDICYKGMSNYNAINQHKSKAHRQVFICDVCSVTFDKKSALNTHLSSLETTCVDVRPCSACGENFKNEAELENHIMSVHPYQRPDFTTTGRKIGSRNKVRCCPCGHKETQNDGDGQQIELQMPDTNTENSDVCTCPCKLGKTRKRRLELDREGNIRYCSEEDGDAPKKQKFMCEVCAKDNFQSEARLRKHQRQHYGEKHFPCPLCPSAFRGRMLLAYHMNVHTGERPFKCPHCPKAFKSPTGLQRHQLVHTKERPYSCDICDKTFQSSTCVKLHVRTVHMKIPMPPRVRNRKKN